MHSDDVALELHLVDALSRFSKHNRPLPGLDHEGAMETLIAQMIESVHRIRYIKVISQRRVSSKRADPLSELFDPIKAAIVHLHKGEYDQACWMVFLFTHFGKNRKSGYRLIRDVYGQLGNGKRWDWMSISENPHAFRKWLADNQTALRSNGVHRGFGNHRKYQSLDAWKDAGTGAAVESYVQWVQSFNGHHSLFRSALDEGRSPEGAFAVLYKSMQAVVSFGRTARFDHLAMIGKLGICPIAPNSVYLQGATGPADGARLLFKGSLNAAASFSQLETWADELATNIDLDKQAMEDSLCNWQKSPYRMVRFRG